MKRKLIFVFICLLTLPIAGRAETDEPLNISSYFEGFTVFDARIQAQGPRLGDSVRSYGLIGEGCDLGLEGEGKEAAKLAAETMKNLRLDIVDPDAETLPTDANWHFSVSIKMDTYKGTGERLKPERIVTLAFYDFSRLSEITVIEMDKIGACEQTVIYEGWCEVPAAALRTFEDLYLRRVCALFRDGADGHASTASTYSGAVG